MSWPSDCKIDLAINALEEAPAITRKMVQMLLPWDGFPVRYRLMYLAQRGRCGLCRKKLALRGPFGEPDTASHEHVWPKIHGGPNALYNAVLTHTECNVGRGSTPPTPELIAFWEETHERLDCWERKRTVKKRMQRPDPNNPTTRFQRRRLQTRMEERT